MPRTSRVVIPAYPHHVIQRGNNRQTTFFAEADYRYYLECLRQAKKKCACRVYAYVLMPNHVHLLVEPATSDDLGDFMQSVGRRYVRYINETHQRSGTLWEGRYKSAIVDRDDYLLRCSRYIELNPVRAGVVQHPADYRWSSYRSRALGELDGLLDEDPWYQGLGHDARTRQEAYQAWMASTILENEWPQIRDATQRGHVIGRKGFQQEIEAMSGRRAAGKPGRPRKERSASIENVL
ncbi:MAG: transposase [Nitrospirota bacterium]